MSRRCKPIEAEAEVRPSQVVDAMNLGIQRWLHRLILTALAPTTYSTSTAAGTGFQEKAVDQGPS